jgi:hypothetical protein
LVGQPLLVAAHGLCRSELAAGFLHRLLPSRNSVSQTGPEERPSLQLSGSDTLTAIAARSIGVSRLFCAKSITPDGGYLIFAVSRTELIAMSEKEKVKSEIQILRDAFEGMKGCQPRSDQELKEWLATDEGKEATMFESTAFSRFGETGHA